MELLFFRNDDTVYNSITRPANSPTAIARNGSMPLAIIPATSALDNAKIEPTDKSIPLLKLRRSFQMQ